jgi:aspartate beta-hydroxylase
MYPGLPQRPWYDASEIPLALELERAAPAIARELGAVDAAVFQRESEPNLAREGEWDVLFLYERGRRNDANCAAVPAASHIVDAHPSAIRDLGGLAYFSRLAPNTHVKPHRGPTNLRVRVHLGLHVPPDCGIAVAGEPRTWDEGRCLVFDDSFVHEVWNRSDRERIVLIVDVWHPALSRDEIELLTGLHRYAMSHAANLSAYWAHNERARTEDAPGRAGF